MEIKSGGRPEFHSEEKTPPKKKTLKILCLKFMETGGVNLWATRKNHQVISLWYENNCVCSCLCNVPWYDNTSAFILMI